MDWSNISMTISDAWSWYTKNRENLTPIGAFLGAFLLSWAALRQARIAARRHYAQTEADRQRRITESYSKAMEQLSGEKIEQRLGGIYTLERISRESPDDYWTIMETLTAFVRERARWKEPDIGSTETLARFYEKTEINRVVPATDIAAVLTVIKRRSNYSRTREKREKWRLDLRGVNLARSDLGGVHLEGAYLSDTHLEGTFLSGAHLEGANLYRTYLKDANLGEVHLEGGYLVGAYLEGAHFGHTYLNGAQLTGAEGLTQAQLDEACGTDVRLDPGLTIEPCQ